jgi:hypothetical protein
MSARATSSRTGRRVAVLLGRAAAVAALAFGVLLVAAPTASACDVSYDYKPSFSFDRPGLGGGVCSTGTSLTGAAVVGVLALGAVAGAAAVAVRRGRAVAESYLGPDRTAEVLSGYLTAASTAPPPPPPTPPPPGNGVPG